MQNYIYFFHIISGIFNQFYLQMEHLFQDKELNKLSSCITNTFFIKQSRTGSSGLYPFQRKMFSFHWKTLILDVKLAGATIHVCVERKSYRFVEGRFS